MESYVELGLLPPELYPERAQLAAEELDQDLYAAAYTSTLQSTSGEPEQDTENSVYNFNEILDAMGID